MISAATGAMALLMVMLVKSHGLQYLLAATLLTGVLQSAHLHGGGPGVL
jgi:SulP family sulfate permease